MDSIVRVVVFMLGLIALYLVVVNAGGSATVLGAIENTTVNETKALQGR